MIQETSVRTTCLICVMIVLIVGAVLFANWLMTTPWQGDDDEGIGTRPAREFLSIP